MVAINKEAIEQIKVIEWIKQCTDLPVIHVANERSCSPQQGALLKRMGVMAGVSDIFIPRAIDTYHGAFVELKTKTGKLSDKQVKFIELMQKEGYYADVCFGSKEAIVTIANLYGLEIPFI